ncbi:MAG: hypothetical protein BAJALOKI2v1_70033 [Promethearchaeota archaeon]|nr:MAG: hypothetical protein BAJALOKI2v1_70033 [Candidatus Lokiarchaeota archaeon]
MITQIPKILYQNEISQILDKIRMNYGIMTRKGYIYGLLATDQDAKIIAVDSRFDKDLNYWDLCSIGAALYGVSKQGRDFFNAEILERAAVIYNNMRLFVHKITTIKVHNAANREILLLLLTDKDVNLGIIFLQMEQFAPLIKEAIEKNEKIRKRLELNEAELKEHIRHLKEEVFQPKTKV